MEELTDLILTMIVALDEHDGLNFTKIDIDNLIKKYDILNNIKCNELGWIILWEENYITDEMFAKNMDVEFEDDKMWIVCDGFSDILPKGYDMEVNVLDMDEEWWERGDFYDNYDVEQYWDNYNEETLKEIIDWCIKNSIEIVNDEDDEELVTKENLILRDGEIYFNTIPLEKLIDNDELNELKIELSIAISEAQEDAEKSEYYDEIKKSFERKVGEFKTKTVKTKNFKGEEKNVEKLYVEINESFDDIKKFLKDEYNEYDFRDEKYGNLLYVLREMEYFEFKKPYYDGIYGSIDKDLLNEYTQSRLNF